LREPKERLLHLLELEAGTKPAQVQSVPAELMSLFMEVSQVCRRADIFLDEKAKTTSPLLQVNLFERGQQHSSELNALQQRIALRRDKLIVELKELDQLWTRESGPDKKRDPNLLQSLEQLYRLFSYFSRWSSQIQERIIQLSL
jgi:hypothetical protein